MVKVLIAHEIEVVREGLKRILSGYPNIEVVSENILPQTIYIDVISQKPTVVIMSIEWDDVYAGLAAVRQICQLTPKIWVIGIGTRLSYAKTIYSEIDVSLDMRYINSVILYSAVMAHKNNDFQRAKSFDNHVSRVKVFEEIMEKCDCDEIIQFCFELGLDHENWPHKTKQELIRGLILHLDHRDKVDKLIDVVRKNRPDIQL